MDTPAQSLAAKIIERLIAENLLLPDDRRKLLVKLAEGKLRPEDWRLSIELASEKESMS
jgi:hypothetical protein